MASQFPQHYVFDNPPFPYRLRCHRHHLLDSNVCLVALHCECSPGHLQPRDKPGKAARSYPCSQAQQGSPPPTELPLGLEKAFIPEGPFLRHGTGLMHLYKVMFLPKKGESPPRRVSGPQLCTLWSDHVPQSLQA